MTEYELGELINGVSSNIIGGQALFLTALSAYMVVAYSVGKSLTIYQVVFINTVFLLVMIVGIQGQWSQMEMVFGYSDQLRNLRGDGGSFYEIKGAVGTVFVGIRAIIAVGALIFMWQVRHPKAG